MVKKLSISILLGILMVMPFQVFAARTDGGMWDQISNYIQTNCVGGCNVLVNGVSKYLNFGTVSGTNGYGFRDNAGTMQWKNSGGAWANIAAGGAGSQTPWTSDIDGAGYTLSNAYLTATATTLDLAGVTNSLVYANGIGRLTSIATTSLGLPTFSDLSSYLTISSWYATTTDGLDEGLTNLYFTNPRVLTYLNTLSKGYFWSTTSADHWDTTKNRWATTSSDYWFSLKTTTNLPEGSNLYYTSARATTSFNTLIGAIDKGYFFSTTSADAWKLTKDFWATTSADYWYTLQNRASSTLYADIGTWANTQTMNITGLAGSATKLATARAINGVNFDGTAPITITAASSTLLANSNTWSGSNVFGNATSSTFAITNINSGLLLKTTTGGAIVPASAGTDYQAAGSYVTTSRNINTTYPLGGGGDLSTDRTLTLAFGTTTSNLWAGTQTFTNAPIFSSLTGLLKGNGAGALTVAANGTDYSLITANTCGSGHFSSVTAAGVFTCTADSGTGGGASQWATSTLFSNMIHTAGAHGVGIGTTTPIGVLSLASSSAVTQWFNHTGASANKRLGYISWANGLFDFGTSSDAGATTSWLKMEEGTTTVSSPVLAVTNGGYTSRLIAGTGTSTLPGGINLQSGCLALNGTCLGTMALSGSIGQTQYYSGVNTAVGTSSLFIATSQNVGVGSTSPFAKLSVQGTAGLGTLFAVASSTNAQLFNIDHRGYVGIGSSTPWGVLSIIDPIGGSLFNPGVITATSTVDLPFFGWTASTSAAAGSEIRILAGNPSAYMSHGDSFDQLLINGRVNTGDWKQLECASDFNSKTAQITSDITGSVMSVALGKPCGDFSYIEDANGVADQVVTTGSGYVRLRPGATGATVVAGDGIGLAGTTAFLRHATNTPVMEATLRKGASQNASTSITMVGFSAATGVSANYATDAQDGCMFVASTTGNWKAVCRATTATIVDTGVASSSVTTGDGVFMKFRVELHNLNGTNYAVFRILQSKTASWQTVATINTNIPSGISLNPIVSIGKVSAGLSPELHVGRIRVWYNDPLWY